MPTVYELELRVNLPYHRSLSFGEKNWTVDGSVRIHLTCLNATTMLKLHAKELVIRPVRLLGDGGEELRIVPPPQVNSLIDILHIELVEPLVEGRNYTLEANYTAQVKTALEGGLYRSAFRWNNETR